MNIKDIRPGAGIEIKATIVSIQPLRKIWQCFECKKNKTEPFRGVWKTEEEFMQVCPNCGAEEKRTPGQGLWVQNVTSALIKDDSGMTYLDLWNDDIGKHQIGEKIHIINGFAKKRESGSVSLGKGKFGSILNIPQD